jgi:RNA polymerase sigma-70 factor, ECF subfamily
LAPYYCWKLPERYEKKFTGVAAFNRVSRIRGQRRKRMTNVVQLKQPASADFEILALPHLNDLYRTARRVIGNPTEAEDVVQETYLQALKSFHRFQPGTNIRAWLFKILFHVAAHHRRKLYRFKPADLEDANLAETLSYETAPLAHWPERLSDKEVLRAFEQIPQSYRAVVMLADVQEFAYKEIADILQIPIGTVMSRLNRGRKALREALQPTHIGAAFVAEHRLAVGE